jgi:hypothetical protein
VSAVAGRPIGRQTLEHRCIIVISPSIGRQTGRQKTWRLSTIGINMINVINCSQVVENKRLFFKKLDHSCFVM